MKTLLLGDVSPTKVSDPMFDAMKTEELFHDVVNLFEGNTLNFVNLECAITTSEEEIEKYGPALKCCFNTAKVLKQLGVTHCGLSNNHIFDYGKRGIRDTFEALEAVGIGYTGFGNDYEDSRKNLVIEENGEKVTVITVCEHEYSYALEDRMGSRPFDEFHTIEDIRLAKENSDRVIVIYHGGKEHCRYPSPRLRRACQAMARNGADVILCQHSHCIGSYEWYDNCHILYGQGNFHFIKPGFDMGEHCKSWNESLAVKYDTGKHEIEFVPIVVRDNGIAIAKDRQREEILNAFFERNKELLDERWKTGWHDFCTKEVKDIYWGCVANAFTANSTDFQNGQFGHFLDCEAHTDVWRELFPTANGTNERNNN